MFRFTLFVACALLVLNGAFVYAEDKPAKFELSADEKVLLELTNQARADEKLPALKPNAKLFQAARAHSENMAKQEMMAHELDGKRPSDRVKATGYVYKEIGENVGVAENATANAVVKGWLNSKAHRENMLKPAFTEIGLGIATDAKGKVYYTQVFGMPR